MEVDILTGLRLRVWTLIASRSNSQGFDVYRLRSRYLLPLRLGIWDVPVVSSIDGTTPVPEKQACASLKNLHYSRPADI